MQFLMRKIMHLFRGQPKLLHSRLQSITECCHLAKILPQISNCLRQMSKIINPLVQSVVLGRMSLKQLRVLPVQFIQLAGNLLRVCAHCSMQFLMRKIMHLFRGQPKLLHSRLQSITECCHLAKILPQISNCLRQMSKIINPLVQSVVLGRLSLQQSDVLVVKVSQLSGDLFGVFPNDTMQLLVGHVMHFF